MKPIGTSGRAVDFLGTRTGAIYARNMLARRCVWAHRESPENSSESRCRCTTQQELNYNDLDARAEDGGKLPSSGERERRRRRGRKLVGEIAEWVFFFCFFFEFQLRPHLPEEGRRHRKKKKTAIASWSMWEIERYCRRHWLETLTFPRSGRDKRLTRLTEGVNAVSEGRVWKTQPFFPVRINSLGGSWERDKSPQQIRS